MTKLLFVLASSRGTAAKSNQVADAYLAALRARNPNLEVDILPLWETDPPIFDGDKVAAKGDAVRLAQAHGSV